MAGISITDSSNVLKTLKDCKITDANNVLKQVREIWATDANNVKRLVWQREVKRSFVLYWDPRSTISQQEEEQIIGTNLTGTLKSDPVTVNNFLVIAKMNQFAGSSVKEFMNNPWGEIKTLVLRSKLDYSLLYDLVIGLSFGPMADGRKILEVRAGGSGIETIEGVSDLTNYNWPDSTTVPIYMLIGHMDEPSDEAARLVLNSSYTTGVI